MEFGFLNAFSRIGNKIMAELINTAISIIPKGINELFFVAGLVGGVILIASNKKDIYRICAALTILAIMIAWRVCLAITSSRYASGLIIVFILTTSYFFCWLSDHNFIGRKGVISVLSFFVLLLIHKTFKIDKNHIYYDAVPELVQSISSKDNKVYYLTSVKEYHRILYMSRVSETDFMFHKKSQEEVINFLKAGYKYKDYQVFINFFYTGDDDFMFMRKNQPLASRMIMSIKSYNNKNKKNIVFLMSQQ